MNKTIRALQQRRAKAVQAARAMLDGAAKDERDLTAEEITQYEEARTQIDLLSAQIDREQTLVEMETSAGAIILPDGPLHVEENAAADPKHGFRSFGEFAMAVQRAGMQGGGTDERLRIGAAAPTTFGNESSGPDGGFLIPPEYSTSIWTLTVDQTNLLTYTDGYTVSGNSMVFPKDETTPWGTDGIRAYWQDEASLATQTKPKYGTTSLRLKKLMALVPLTDELLADAATLSQYLSVKIAASIRWKTNEAILYGPGTAQPLGALNSGAAVVVAKESAQATNTLLPANLAKMIARLPEGSYGKSIWLVNNDVLPALFTLTLGNYPIYMPIGGVKDNPYGMIFGRPALVTQHAKSFSSQGDVQLHDLTYYRSITKAAGIETAVSMHLYFDADATAFRATFRIDGEPTLSVAITPANGSALLSPFVQLGAR